ncbi:hypothetical protein A3A46_03320 [Candidatus Roizmanbacteria bacterium RIFCSPLOWO2_01_FULL_37_13]|uniref:Undecaprenyl-diphosphatase n=1 Tax=Candidatus Roizmanbacteria bacterium RIFCSPHIGHO2_02_FULL_38_11 TaxID=1802039 RepID=A0A1F7GWI2_9BACT|nr:MAG: hypothetical protein A3C25_02155 [Candidatus Roizmanbacteria bacterium RIFCSPHIGHO2_02_FULL_38_11]OGK43162.1 MAG: hypothetical protein A3A46_03320 [Candidatus Roizmanbacteria bacterium RIFCSPLOWO2_01_FULL_37_13]
MSIIQAIILGLVEGVTEFLPISSTFHLIFTAKILGITQNNFTKLFEVFIQSGAILSVALLYFTNVVKYRELTKRVIFSFLPTAFVGFILYKFIKNVLFESQIFLVGIFVATGAVFIIVESLIRKDKVKLKKGVADLTYKEALIIGLAQSLAVIPGVSRAGAVIVGMMLFGFKRSESAYYSFLLSIPTIFSASLFDLYKMKDLVNSNYLNNWSLLAVGFLSAFISSYFVIKWFIDFLKKNSLVIFGYYRLIVAIILLSILLK